MYFREDLFYPRPGTGLNHPAVLTFYNIRPKHLKDEGAFIEFLKGEARKMDAEFVSYDKATAEWQIRVKHFSRYGLDVDDAKRPREGDDPVHSKRVREATTTPMTTTSMTTTPMTTTSMTTTSMTTTSVTTTQPSFQEDTRNLARVAAATHASFSVLSLLASLPQQAALLFQQMPDVDAAGSFAGTLTAESLITMSPAVSIAPRARATHPHSLDTLRAAAVYVESSTALSVPQLQLPQGAELQLLVDQMAQTAPEAKSGLLWELVRILFVNGE